MSEPENSDFYCSQLAREADEPLFGTALQAEVWFLLEVNQPWAAQATSDNKLPRPVQAWLAAQVAAGPSRRLQFIRQDRAGRQKGLNLFIALASESAPAVYRFPLADYQALFQLDVEAVVRRESKFQRQLHPDPLILVCTNGKRDRCCARFGAAFYREIARHVGPAAWQTTHLGGHRFAATALLFPDGVSCGHLLPEDAPNLLQAQRQGELLLDRLRGRLCYAPLIQTAAYYLHRQTGDSRLGAFRHVGTQELGAGHWALEFDDQAMGRHRIELAQAEQPLQTVASCGAAAPKPRVHYQFLGHAAG